MLFFQELNFFIVGIRLITLETTSQPQMFSRIRSCLESHEIPTTHRIHITHLHGMSYYFKNPVDFPFDFRFPLCASQEIAPKSSLRYDKKRKCIIHFSFPIFILNSTSIPLHSVCSPVVIFKRNMCTRAFCLFFISWVNNHYVLQ